MAQLYFTSSEIPSKQFLSLEELFTMVPPQEILLVFDTNIVVYYRDFFLNPRHFVTNKPEVFKSIEYLVDSIHFYDLEVNSSIGNDESSRSKLDFSISREKARQTRDVMQMMFSMTKHSLNYHTESYFKLEPVFISQELSDSKVLCLKQESTFSGILTLSYACVLKIFLLFCDLESGKIDRRKAYLDFLNFAMEEADGVAVLILSFAYHLFGGVNAFRSMLFAKGKALPKEKLHQLFNGALDLIYPYVVNRAQDFFPIPNKSEALIPILVTGDRRLSILHSICNKRYLVDQDKVLMTELPLAQLDFFAGEKTKWTTEDKAAFKIRTAKDIKKRYASATGPHKSTEHLYPIIEKLETQVWNIFNQ
jgi:hypothetical protein